ncbi:MAG: hypothetical protein ACTSSP_00790 [Candidatus Asgardarchaeia archaeon]
MSELKKALRAELRHWERLRDGEFKFHIIGDRTEPLQRPLCKYQHKVRGEMPRHVKDAIKELWSKLEEHEIEHNIRYVKCLNCPLCNPDGRGVGGATSECCCHEYNTLECCYLKLDEHNEYSKDYWVHLCNGLIIEIKEELRQLDRDKK